MKISMPSLSAMNSWIGGAVALVLMSTATMLQAQGTKADYERFDKIGGITGGKVFRTKVQAHWLTGTKCFWYRNDLGHGRKNFVFVDAAVGKQKSGFRPRAVWQRISRKQPARPSMLTNCPSTRSNIRKWTAMRRDCWKRPSTSRRWANRGKSTLRISPSPKTRPGPGRCRS